MTSIIIGVQNRPIWPQDCVDPSKLVHLRLVATPGRCPLYPRRDDQGHGRRVSDGILCEEPHRGERHCPAYW